MKLARAVEIVLELARDNALSKAEARENDLSLERDRQLKAIKTVENFYRKELAE